MSITVFDFKDERLYRPIDRILGIDGYEWDMINAAAENAWKRCIYCFSKINNVRFNTGGIQPYHCIQYGMWLYFLSNEIFNSCEDKKEASHICDKIFMINMSITQMDIFYEHNMPDIFLPAHASAAVFSPRAKIGDYFVFMHGCNIGLNNSTDVPQIGDYVIMFGNSKIIGNCHVGDHVVFSANSYIKDMDIPSHSIVFGQYPNVKIVADKDNKTDVLLRQRFHLID